MKTLSSILHSRNNPVVTPVTALRRGPSRLRVIGDWCVRNVGILIAISFFAGFFAYILVKWFDAGMGVR